MTKRVGSRVYNMAYYLHECDGSDLFNATHGNVLDERRKKIISLIHVNPNEKVLDIGCGRGEVAIWLAKQGCQVVGIDYSASAIKLANKALLLQPKAIQQKIKFQRMNLNNLVFSNTKFDVVICTEVLEHIYPDEQDQLLKQIKVILKPEGFLFIHTSPSKWFFDFTYRYWCYPIGNLITNLWNFVFNKHYGNLVHWSKLRNEYHKIMHVNEPDYFSLMKLFFRNNYYGIIYSSNVTVKKPILSWKDTLFNFMVYLSPLSNFPPLNILWGNDYYAILRPL